ncbi:MAG: glycerol kinase GlpK [Blastocatellia bacterium]|nr:glycerol kinase GlpK [Blastocatellia bacterium]
MKAILAIDEGTTNVKALLVDAAGAVIARASRSLEQTWPHPGWVEQNPTEIRRRVQEVIDECLLSGGEHDLAAIAITNQRESVMLWDRRTGEPVGPVVVWQCRRTAPFCEELRARGLERTLRERTGLTIDPLFSASKARWLLDNIAGARARAESGELCLGTMDSWVLWHLTRGAVHACDVTNASRTQLFDLRRLAWDEELLSLFDVPAAILPDVRSSSAVYGASVPLGRLPGGVPIAGLIGDSHAALYGQAGFQPGVVKATYGTGSSLMTRTAAPVISEHGLSTTIAWEIAAGSREISYALEGNISVTGAAVQWLGEFLNLPDPARDVARLAAGVAGNQGVYLVPDFVGLGAPYWNDAARGLLTGLTRGTTAAHAARAVLEAIAHQIRDVFDVMDGASPSGLSALLADGGGSGNDWLMQFQADILGRPVLRCASPDLSAIGAAYLAGLAVEVWRSEEEIAALPRRHDRFEPRMSPADRDEHYAGWRRAVSRALLDAGHLEQVNASGGKIGAH